MTPDEAETKIAALEYQVKVLAWLHAGLVHELSQLLNQLMGATADPSRAAALRSRAMRIARIRASQAPLTAAERVVR